MGTLTSTRRVEVAAYPIQNLGVKRIAIVGEVQHASMFEVAPTMLRALMFSLNPSTPGFSEQMPRTINSLSPPPGSLPQQFDHRGIH